MAPRTPPYRRLHFFSSTCSIKEGLRAEFRDRKVDQVSAVMVIKERRVDGYGSCFLKSGEGYGRLSGSLSRLFSARWKVIDLPISKKDNEFE